MLPKNQFKNYGNNYAPKLQSDCINYLFPSLKKRNRIAVSEKIPDVRLDSISPDVIKSKFSLLAHGFPFLHSWPVAIGSFVSKTALNHETSMSTKVRATFFRPDFQRSLRGYLLLLLFRGLTSLTHLYVVMQQTVFFLRQRISFSRVPSS